MSDDAGFIEKLKQLGSNAFQHLHPHNDKQSDEQLNQQSNQQTDKQSNQKPPHDSSESIKNAESNCHYDRIEEHGVIGNMRTCALVSVKACVKWYCYPNFDSPSIFASILDCKIGGHWSIESICQSEGGKTDFSSSSEDEESLCEGNQSNNDSDNISTNQSVDTDEDSEDDDDDNDNRRRRLRKRTKQSNSRSNKQSSKEPTDESKDQSIDQSNNQMSPDESTMDESDDQSISQTNQSNNQASPKMLNRSIASSKDSTHPKPAFKPSKQSHNQSKDQSNNQSISQSKPHHSPSLDRVSPGARSMLVDQEDDQSNNQSNQQSNNQSENQSSKPSKSACVPTSDEALKHVISHKQIYHSETNILVSRFLSEAGVGQVLDFMPVGECSEKGKHQLIRELSVVRGSMKFCITCVPAFDYGREGHQVVIEPFGARFITSRLTMELRTSRRREWRLSPCGRGVVGYVTLDENETEVFVFSESDRCSDGHYRTGDESKIFQTGPHQTDRRRDDWNQGRASDTKSDCQVSKEEKEDHATDKSPEPITNHTNNQTDDVEPISKKVHSHHEPTKERDTVGLANGSKKRDRHGKQKCDCSTTARRNEQARRRAMENEISLIERSMVLVGLNMTKDEFHRDEARHTHACTIQPASLAITHRLKLNSMKFWRDWVAKCTYTGRWREIIHRSALCLKLMTFEPTGAIVAALTTSLPEQIGGVRNWDYRFTWIRDSSFTLYAFLKLGYKTEATAFMRWISQRCEESGRKDGSLQIMYGIHGEHHLEEIHLDHLSGYLHSKPVRIGNAAYDQRQLDIYGEFLDTVYLSNKYSEPISYEFWQHVRKMVEWVCVNWHLDDEGIWETRSGRKPFVYSKVMAWVCLDRGIRLAEKRSLPCDLVKWHSIRNAIYEEIQTKGWNEKRQAYTQYYGSDVLDASVLIMPLVFFSAPTDPRFISTLQQILKSTSEGGLVSNNLVFRYNPSVAGDGLSGDEGTFSICSFWAIEAAARLGAYRQEYLEKSRLMFEQMLGYSNHLGLYAEEIGKRGNHLGNYPQAFTHLALISAAINLDKSLNLRAPPAVSNMSDPREQ